MDTLHQRLETLFAAVREMPEAEQVAAVEALAEIAQAPYCLSEDELATLEPALERVCRGEMVDDSVSLKLLGEPWRKSSTRR